MYTLVFVHLRGCDEWRFGLFLTLGLRFQSWILVQSMALIINSKIGVVILTREYWRWVDDF